LSGSVRIENRDELGDSEFAIHFVWRPGDTIPLGGGTLRVPEVDWTLRTTR
jgi:hypothetical protein